jgi:hypothetical protein
MTKTVADSFHLPIARALDFLGLKRATDALSFHVRMTSCIMGKPAGDVTNIVTLSAFNTTAVRTRGSSN